MTHHSACRGLPGLLLLPLLLPALLLPALLLRSTTAAAALPAAWSRRTRVPAAAVPAAWPRRTRALAASVLREAQLVAANVTAHPFPNHLADAALGLLLATNGSDPAAARNASGVFRYMFDNGIGFGMSFGGVFAATTLRRFADVLPTPTVDNLTAALWRELPSTPHAASTIDVSYNNIYLMNAMNLIVVGEAVHDRLVDQPSAATHDLDPARALNASVSGYEQVRAWMAFAFENGIHEFTSPTYTWVQFEGMYNGFMWMKDQGVRAKLRASLDHLWAQLSANFFRGDMAQQLSGPHSRDYDTLFGKGGTYTHLYMQGLVDWPYECEADDLHCEGMGPNPFDTGGAYTPGINQAGSGLQNVVCLANAVAVAEGSPRGYVPAPAALALAAGSSARTSVVRSWFGNLTSDRYNFVSPRFSIGTVGEDYVTNTHTFYTPCPQAKAVNVLLANDWPPANPMPNTIVSPHWEDVDVYGRQERPVHLPLHPLSVQHDNEALVLLQLNGALTDLDGFSVPVNATFLSTNVLLPRAKGPDGKYGGGVAYAGGQNTAKALAAATLWSNASWRQDIGASGVVAVRVGQAAVAVRVVDASACAGHTVSLALRGDAGPLGGLAHGAIRFELRHFEADRAKNETIPSACSQAPVRAALLVAAYDLVSPDDAALLALTQRLIEAEATVTVTPSTGVWSVRVATPGGTVLEAARSLRADPLRSVGKGALYRRVNGMEFAQTAAGPQFLQVNGRALFPLPTP